MFFFSVILSVVSISLSLSIHSRNPEHRLIRETLMSLINNRNKCSRHGNSGELSCRSLGSCGTVYTEIRHCSWRPGLDTDVHKSLDLLCDHFIILKFCFTTERFWHEVLYFSQRLILKWIPDFSSAVSSKKEVNILWKQWHFDDYRLLWTAAGALITHLMTVCIHSTRIFLNTFLKVSFSPCVCSMIRNIRLYQEFF